MNRKIIVIFLMLINFNAIADNEKISCKGNDHYKWNDCVGSIAKDGTAYVGNFKNGLYHGQGTFTFSDGATYVGKFENGKESGVGTFTCWVHGAIYTGEFKNGMKHGKGQYKYPDGSFYNGNWELGKKHGQGTYIYPDGKKDIGKFKNDKYVGS